MSQSESRETISDSPDVDRMIDAFEESLWSGKHHRVEDFLADADFEASTDRLVIELSQVELEHRIQAGEPVEVEEYLERFPHVEQDPDGLLQLIVAECRIRRQHGFAIKLGEYASRFPQLAESIETALDSRRSAGRKSTRPRSGHDAAALLPEQRPVSLGKFQLLEEIGRGTYGTVFRALDTKLQRVVAVKVPRETWLTDTDDEELFFREARNAAQLHHHGIVPVFEAGRDRQHCYLVSEFVDGETLAEAISQREFTFRDTAVLVAHVGEALQHAHQRGIIHRDLKPTNIMLGDNGVPRVMDFGLAKRSDGGETMTLDGQVVGTPAYMAPEQARGEVHRVDARCDIYALGVILYELLTGELPFRGSREMLAHQVIHEDPREPRSLNDRIPRDLQTICGKAMAKEPERRYATAGDFAADLHRWLDGRPIEARPVGRLTKAWKWAGRNAGVAVLVTCVGLLLVAISAVSTWSAIALSRSADKERRAAAEAIAASEREQQARIEAQRERDAARQAQAQALREKRVADRVSEFIVGLFEASDPVGLGGSGLNPPVAVDAELTVAEMLQRARGRIELELAGQPLVRARLMATLANVYRNRGDLQTADELITSVQQNGKLAEFDPVERARLQFVRASVRHDQGVFDEAQRLYESVLEVQEEHLGRRDLETQATLFNYAWLLADQVAATDQEVPPEDPRMRYEQLFREVLRERRAQLGDGHRDVAIAMTGLLIAMTGSGRDDQVQEMLVDAMKIYQAQPGGGEIGMAISLFVTGTIARQNGRLEKAISDYRKGTSIGRRILGPKHPIVAIALGELAGTLKQAGRMAEAEATVLEALKISRSILPNGHPRMIPALVELGEWRADHGRFGEAESLLREAISISRRFSVGHEEDVCLALLRLGLICFARGDFDEADAFLLRVIEFGIPPGRDSNWPYLSEAKGARRRLSVEGGHHAEALRDCQAAVVQHRARFTERSSRVTHQPLIAVLERAKFDFDGGIYWRLASLGPAPPVDLGLTGRHRASRQISNPRDHLFISDDLQHAARMKLAAGEIQQATEYASQSVERLARCVPTDSWLLAAARATHAACLTEQGAYSQAEAMLLEAHQKLSRSLGAAHFRTAETLQHMIRLYRRWEKPEQAQTYQQAWERLAW